MCKVTHYFRRLIEEQNHPRFISANLLRYSRLSNFIVLNRGIYKIRFFGGSGVATAYWLNPHFRFMDEIIVESCLKTGDTFVDVGANVGTVALAAAAKVGQSGRVIAIEAHPTTYRHLQENIALSQVNHIQVFNYAVGAAKGTIHFKRFGNDDMRHVIYGEGIQLPLDTLDNLITLETIHLLKIDVEGFEKEVLKGAEATLQKTHMIYIETDENALRRFDTTIDEIHSLLREHNFQLYQAKESPANTIAVRNLAEWQARTQSRYTLLEL